MKKFVKIGLAVLIVFLAGFIYWNYFFVFSEGIKGGSLNYFEKKGIVFKTYEGRLVQDGFQSPQAGALQSNEFRFSAIGDEVAQQLERASGKFVELRYKEYLGKLPWRGASKYVVYEVVEIDNAAPKRNNEIPATTN
ncbi:hypothetical protein [Mongoliibacter ruber]|uniref:6-phosphogluconate dehydrogenase n=1 Tax=Mongoliibacter ruber TaxID=1750599 RepID=A0A2T0WK16_9BACT|nr:hypothetical protein [Mongoliibacter ruber]PRY87039.1 hypothetical protein CLW00_107108 [Mongoliibacter ruber]